MHVTYEKNSVLDRVAEDFRPTAKALYIGKLSLPADVIQLSRLYLFMVELMAQNTSKFISKIFLCLVFYEIKLKLVSNCFFASIKRYIKEELSLIKE